MRQSVKASALKVGMHVVLPSSWFSHPFLTNSFTIKSRNEIDKIIQSGFDEVLIDLDRGIGIEEEKPAARKEPESKTWDPDKLIPPELREAIHDKRLAPEKKAEVVYQSSHQLMQRLLEDPKADNIREAKKGVAEIVDLIVSDSETSQNLLKITSHDYYTYTHSVNVGIYSIMLAREYFGRSDRHDMQELGAGFFLHDIGKVHIDPAIINKPGRLTNEEMETMRSHPYQGYKVLSDTGHLTDECRFIVMEHHERENGTGYPRKLKGDEIHIYGRICSAADVYDALTAERSYKPKRSTFEAFKIMKEEMIGHFKKDLFETLVRLFEEKK